MKIRDSEDQRKSEQAHIEKKKSEVHITQKEHDTSLKHSKKHQKRYPQNRTRVWPKVNEQPHKKGHRI